MFELITKLFTGRWSSGAEGDSRRSPRREESARDPMLDSIHAMTAGKDEFDEEAVARMIDEGCPHAYD